MSNMAATESCSFEWIVLSLDGYHRRGLITFRHRRQPLSVFRLLLVAIILVDVGVDLAMTFVLEYDDQLFFKVGNPGRFYTGSSYRAFGTVVCCYKLIGTALLINHMLTDYRWIREVDHKLALAAPRVVVSRQQMRSIVKFSQRFIISFTSMAWTVAQPNILYHVLVTYRHLTWCELMPSLLQAWWLIVVYTFLITSFVGEYYLMVQYCIALVEQIDNSFQDMIRRNKTVAQLNQGLSDFEIVCEVIYLINDYIGRIYFIYSLIMFILFPICMFTILFVNVNVVFKILMGVATSYYYLLMCFMSQVAGQVNYKIENAAALLYQELLLKNFWKSLLRIKHKVSDYFLQFLF